MPFTTQRRPAKNPARTAALFWLWTAPVLACLAVEVLNGGLPRTILTPLQIVLNLVWYYILEYLFYLCSNRWWTSARFILIFGWALGVVNHYLFRFRGRALFPGDFLTLDTAANVAGNYSYLPDLPQLLVTAAVALLVWRVGKAPREKRPRSLRRALTGCSLSAAFVLLFFGTDFTQWVGITPALWNTSDNGLALNFTVSLDCYQVSPPDFYSANVSVEDPEPPEEGVVPANIIVIMNESLADLSVLGDVPMTADPLAGWRARTENTIKGYAYSSVFGGTTANSEYEFLTGNSMAFLPAGSVPYEMYVEEGDPSLVGQMKALGYTTAAVHPYEADGWNRPEVYADFGFDETHFQEDFDDPETFRGFVSDRADYRWIMDRYRYKDAGEKLFLFNVTMQNHGGYDRDWAGLTPSVALSGDLAGQYPNVDQYLSCVHESDKALTLLLDYFERQEEPTLILLFGEHQPQTYSTFHDDVLGTDAELDVAGREKKQMVPFLLWANYDIPEEEDAELSLNYLSTLLMETAHLPLTSYQALLSQLRLAVPVLNLEGCRSFDGEWHESPEDLTGAARVLARRYEALEYNSVFDREGRQDELFVVGTG